MIRLDGDCDGDGPMRCISFYMVTSHLGDSIQITNIAFS